MCVLALKTALSEGMLLERLGNWLDWQANDRGSKLAQMFFCPFCMPTIQSIVAHAFAFGLGILPMELNWALLIRWPLVVFGASIIAGNFWNVYETINTAKERNEEETQFYKMMTTSRNEDEDDREIEEFDEDNAYSNN